MLSWMRGIAAMRRPFPRAAVFLLPALGLMLAAFAVGVTVVLHDREEHFRARELALVQLRSTVDALQGAAWSARPDAASMRRAEQRSLEQFRALGLAGLVPVARANFAVLGRIAQGRPLVDPQTLTYRSLATQMARATDAARRAAEDADNEALAASAAAFGVLLVSFWSLDFLLWRAHRRMQEARMRLLASTVHGAEEERRWIASELHDGPIQRLSATALSLDLLANRVRRGRLDSVEEGLRDVRDALAVQMESLRRLMSELLPPMLDEGGVAAAIASHASVVLPEQAVCAVKDRTGSVRFVPEVETAVYRIAGEALANIVKHSDATHVRVLLERRGGELSLAVIDDGVGFDGERGASGHLGLTAMRERVESVGGRLRIRSARGEGTRIEATLPWRTPAEEKPRVA